MAGERFVIHARIIGAVHRDTPKLKVFMMSVLWSDETEVIVYRSFQDFKKFHRLLKKRFSNSKPFQKNDRVIPKFRGNGRSSSVQQKGSTRSFKRMKFLESYCNQLLKCDTTVTQNSVVTQFFTPRGQELEPDYTKNSIVILLSDDLPDGSAEGSGDVTRGHASSVTQPFITQTYRCIDAYETKDTKNRPFKVAVEEKLDVLIKDPAGWWLVENESKCLAWFPAPYLELWDGEEDDAAYQQEGALYRATRSYSTQKNDEVSVHIGSVVEVLRESDNGWWLIRFNGKVGYIPSMYLQPYNNPRGGLYSLQRKLVSSTLNLATSRGPENRPQLDSAGPARGASGRLHKAQSLDVLSEALSQMQTERETSTSERSFSYSSSSSESSSSLREEEEHQRNRSDVSETGSSSPDLSLSDRHSSSTGSVRSKDSVMASVVPRVPPRPKTTEILTRCTTMTRKAAMATKTQLQNQLSESIYSR